MEKPLLLLFLLSIATKSTLQQQPTPEATESQSNEEFHEELFIKPLPSGHVNTYFKFTTRWHYGEQQNLHNTKLIPRPIAELLLHFDVKELHVSLTQGLWRYESWGYPVVDSAPGAEVWAWFSAANLTQANVDQQWLRLVGTFSGILCSSLNFIDGTNSLEPRYGFRPRFGAKSAKDIPKYLRYATLPREIVCTENLTPWKKLLPCNSKQGFASLLNSGHVHNTNFHALSIVMRTLCDAQDNNCLLELTESANLVYDPKILGSNDFSLRRMFGQGLNGRCTLAKTSKIYVSLDDESRYELTPAPKTRLTSTRGGIVSTYGVYDIQQPVEKLFNIAWIQRKANGNQPTVVIAPKPPLYAHRFILGHGQERGQLVTRITNTLNTALPLVYQENIPWFVPVYMHTLKLSIVGTNKEISPKAMHYVPGVQRVRSYHLELAFEVPPQSTVQVAFDFDYIFLKWLEYPPDANHGHYLGSAVISTQLPLARNYTAIPMESYLFEHSLNATQSSYFLELRTESLILSLPTPDFSMPYNVICLACTVVALAFGPIHSVATKRIVVESKDDSSSMFGRVKQKLFGKRKSKQEEEVKNATINSSESQEEMEQELAARLAASLHAKTE